MNVKFVYYDRAYKNLLPEIDFEMQRVLSAGDLILRNDVERFEENLAQFVGTKYAVALSSGTDALFLALKAVGIGRGYWSVSVPSHTFKATAGAIKTAHNDVSIDVSDLGEPLYENDIKIPVHIAGELSPIPEGIVIEDACQAMGAVKNPTTSAQCWSFYPAKILGSFGDAGALTTNDENIAEYAREARNHFKKDNREFGGNHRLDNIQAAILNVKMKYLDSYIKRRQEVADMYYEGLKDLEESGKIKLPNKQKGRVYQDFILQVKDTMQKSKRDELYDFLKKERVETMKNEYPWTPEYPKLPLAEAYEAETLRLPCNAEIMFEEVSYVIQKVKEFYGV